MGIFDKLFGSRKEGKELGGKREAVKGQDGGELERILEKMRIPKNEVAEFKKRVESKDWPGLAELADELVARERSRAACLDKKVLKAGDISPWGTEQISKMIDMLMPMLRRVGPTLPVTTKLMERIIAGGAMARTLFLTYIEKAVGDVINEDLKKATKEDIEEWRSMDW